jgi:hemerythrin superfamily protein
MNDADRDRAKAAGLPEKDLIAVLYRQHADIHDLMNTVQTGIGAKRVQAFDRLKLLLSAHEHAEEELVRPVTRRAAGPGVAEARAMEEHRADEALAQLAELDIDSAAFDVQFTQFQKAVSQHAEGEETEEFPALRSGCSPQERMQIGAEFLERVNAAT